jgi:prophage DNA circulation protein
MTWEDQLHKGSFRGVRFNTVETVDESGFRKTIHRYPKKDQVYVENQGRKEDAFTFECFVAGDDYIEQRDNLQAALLKQGSGLLSHPFYGDLTVEILDVRVRQGADELGVARFSIKAISAGSNAFPDNQIESKSIVEQRVTELDQTVIDDFAKRFTVEDLPESVFNQAQTLLTEGVTMIDKLPSFGGDVSGFDFQSLMKSPEQLGRTLSTAVGQIEDVTDLRQLASFKFEEVVMPTITPSRIAQSENQQAINELLNLSSVSQMARKLVSL